MRVLLIFALSLILLNLAAVLVDQMWPVRYYGGGFFSWELVRLNDMPYWLLSNLVLMAINGLALLHNSKVTATRGRSGTFHGELPNTPLIVVGYNLASIPVLVLFPRIGYPLGL